MAESFQTDVSAAFRLELEPLRMRAPQLYVYRWDRQGRKGQTCKVTARGKFNSIRVEFLDGFVMITSGNAIRKVAA